MSRSLVAGIIQSVLAVAVIVGGYLIWHYFISTPPQAGRRRAEDRGVAVRVEVVERGVFSVEISGSGVVGPYRRVELRNEVAGRVSFVHEGFEGGELLSKGEVLLRIDDEEYKLVYSDAQVSVRQAEAELFMEQARVRTASDVQERLSHSFEDKPLDDAELKVVRREPQLMLAMSKVELAKTSVRRAKLNLDKTRIRAPFDLVVLSRNVSVGEGLNAQRVLGEFADSSRYRIEVSVLESDLDWVDIPGVGGKDAGSTVRVEYSFGGKTYEKQGQVSGMSGRLDVTTKRPILYVDVMDPLVGDAPLILGRYVTVHIEGNRSIEGYKVSRDYVREGGKVPVADIQGRLSIREPDVIRRDDSYVYFSSGFSEGERIVVSRLSMAVNGVKLRIEGESVSEGKGAGVGGGSRGGGGKAGQSGRSPGKSGTTERSEGGL